MRDLHDLHSACRSARQLRIGKPRLGTPKSRLSRRITRREERLDMRAGSKIAGGRRTATTACAGALSVLDEMRLPFASPRDRDVSRTTQPVRQARVT